MARASTHNAASAALLLLAALPRTSSAAERCLEYAPTQVSLTGTIFVKEDFGPPGYGEDPAHDSKERHIYIALDKAICVDADSGPDKAQAERNLQTLQMVYAAFPFRDAWIGKHVWVAGTLFHAHTGHHWTPVLITVTDTIPVIR